MPSHMKNPVAVGLYANAGILLGILLVLLHRSSVADGVIPDVLSAAMGQVQNSPSIVGGGGVYVMPAQFHNETWGCFLLDVDAQTLCTYEFDTDSKQLKLISARDFRYDRLLRNFATTPAPWEVEQMVDQEKQTPHGEQIKPEDAKPGDQTH